MDDKSVFSAPWRRSKESQTREEMRMAEASREFRTDVELFRKTFGLNDGTRTPDQQRLMARLRRMFDVDGPVFVFSLGQMTDPLRAANRDGRRDAYFSIEDFINTK